MTQMLTDYQWSKLLSFCRACPQVYVGQEAKLRKFLEGVLWIVRSGAQWRLLPEPYGDRNSVYKRFARWCDRGIWEQLHQFCVDAPDLESLLLDSTSIRAHCCAAGAAAKKGGNQHKH